MFFQFIQRMIRNTNLKDALEKERELLRHPGAMGFVYAMFDVLNEEVYREHEIVKRVVTPNQTQSFHWCHSLDEERIFHRSEIRQLCIKFRLRFLDASQFNQSIPYEAIRRIKALESAADQAFNDFLIAAPAEAFTLPDCAEDPLLFIDLGGDRFYLVHHWGEDMAWHRKVRMFPWRNRRALGGTVFAAALLLTALLPSAFIGRAALGDATLARLAFLGWSFASVAGVIAYFSMRRFKGYSDELWERPFS